jgi:putative glutamine amidotransferase
VRRLGRGLHATAASPDGVVETLELPRHRFALGVQWHPERQETEGPGQHLASALVEAAR